MTWTRKALSGSGKNASLFFCLTKANNSSHREACKCGLTTRQMFGSRVIAGQTHDARGPEVGTKEATLHSCEDWSVDAVAHKPNKYCTCNLAPKRGPYSLAPRLAPGGPVMLLVACPRIVTERIMTTGLVRWMSQAAFQRDMFCSIWQSVQTSTDLQNTHFDWPHHKWTIRGSNSAESHELYSTWRWVQAAATSIQPHIFFFPMKHVH